MVDKEPVMDAEVQVESFFAKYDATIAKLGKALRKKLRARLPGLTEFVYVYENQESLVMSYSPTEHGRDGVCSLAVYPTSVKLYFLQGQRLADADPKKLLQGRAGVRYVELGAAVDFERAEIEALVAAAVTLAGVRLDPKAKGSVIVKADEQKKRAQRTAKTARPAAKATKNTTSSRNTTGATSTKNAKSPKSTTNTTNAKGPKSTKSATSATSTRSTKPKDQR